ncbi:MAG: hypothetical protein ACXWPK_11875 [Isosphaeraceae bacterium]|jgi:hypothetical protein
MGHVAGRQFQAVHQGNGGDHRIGQADGLSGAFEVASNATRRLGGRLAEFQQLLGADVSEQGGDLLGPLDLLEPLDHLHDGDDGEGETAIRLAVSAGISDDGGVNGSEHLGEDVRVEERLIHPT